MKEPSSFSGESNSSEVPLILPLVKSQRKNTTVPPVAKTLVPSVITKVQATETNCAQLYAIFKEQLGTDKIAISIKGASLTGSGGYSTHTYLVHLPRTNTFIAQHCPVGYDHFEVRVEYELTHLDPSTLMTRADFLAELDDIWGSMWKTLPEDSKSRARFVEARELLISTYQARELGNQDYLEATE